MEVFSFSTDRIELKSEEDGDYIIGYVSTHDRDLVDDVVTKNCMMDMLQQLKGGRLKLDMEHETLRGIDDLDKKLNIAKVPLATSVDGIYDGKGLMVKYKMNKKYKKLDSKGDVVYTYDDVKAMIKDDQLDAFSIAFITEKDVERKTDDGMKERLLDKVRWINTALTGNPINRAAGMVDVMLKSLDRVESKPFTDYTSFQDCVNRNKEKRDPDAYCAEIQRQAEGKKSEMKYEEPTRMRDQIAQRLFSKPFDELTDDEKNKVHEVAISEKDDAHTEGPKGPENQRGGNMKDKNEKDLEVKGKPEPEKEEKTPKAEEPKTPETKAEPKTEEKADKFADEIKELKAVVEKQSEALKEIDSLKSQIEEMKALLENPVHAHKGEDAGAKLTEAERKALESFDVTNFA